MIDYESSPIDTMEDALSQFGKRVSGWITQGSIVLVILIAAYFLGHIIRWSYLGFLISQ